MASAAPLLDRGFLEKLERLTLEWQKSFAGLVGGHNPSRFSGAGQEFLDHRNFHHGDDLRAVNWRAFLRLEKLFLKIFQVEPRVPVRILLDTSASMQPKFDFARRLAGALCYVGMVRLDTMQIHPFAQKLGQRYVFTGGRHRFGAVVECLTSLECEGATDFFGVVRDFITTYPQRGLLIAVSDFLDEEGCERPLQYLADFGHELLLLQIWSEEDRTPPWRGELELIDAESSTRLKLQFDDGARQRYTTAFDEYATSLQRLALRTGGRYVGVSTAQALEDVMFGPMIKAHGVV